MFFNRVRFSVSLEDLTDFFIQRDDLIRQYEREYIDYTQMLDDPETWVEQYIELLCSLSTINNIIEFKENVLIFISILQEELETVKRVFPLGNITPKNLFLKNNVLYIRIDP